MGTGCPTVPVFPPSACIEDLSPLRRIFFTARRLLIGRAGLYVLLAHGAATFFSLLTQTPNISVVCYVSLPRFPLFSSHVTWFWFVFSEQNTKRFYVNYCAPFLVSSTEAFPPSFFFFVFSFGFFSC